MAEEKTNRLSEQGRAACSAAGKRNIQHAREAQIDAGSTLRRAAASFEAKLRSQLGDSLTGSQEALVLSAAASYGAIHTVRSALLSARKFKRVETLVDTLPALQGALLRALRGLGLEAGAAEDDPTAPTRGGLADYLASKAREKEGGS